MYIDIPIYKQGELDFSCGLYCLFSVAEVLGLELPNVESPLANIIGPREEGLKSAGPWKGRIMPSVWGVGVDAMEKLAQKMGGAGRLIEPAGDLDVLKEAELSIALILGRFDHPQGLWPSYLDSHFVIVQNDEGTLVLGDSHPWMPSVRPVSDDLFLEMWTHGRLEIPGWALAFELPADDEEPGEAEAAPAP